MPLFISILIFVTELLYYLIKMNVELLYTLKTKEIVMYE